MIVEFTDSVAGVPVYINPAYVVILHPDPSEARHVTLVNSGMAKRFACVATRRRSPTNCPKPKEYRYETS